MTIGALIAFNMLAQRVTGPLVQMVGLINKYQQAALSVRMLAGLLNRRTERNRRGGITADIEGNVTFDRVMFRYAAEGAPTLDGISLDIPHGQRIGVVGRSGSGKSTLVRLIQGLHYPSGGVLRIDGRDVREYDLMHLRMNVGVVLQRSFLFKGTVKENIARARPEAGLEEVIQAAQLAGADQFIEHLPQSYDTMLEEDGSNLSGGQKQRIALARTLLMRPRILILDEATSALDPESEAVIRDNFDKIAAGRTVFNVSHRLSNLTGMDAILVLDAGKVVDYAPHHTLVERCEVYQMLWYTQNPHLRT
jgi:subfamily B ATP-binding cassette protein HlyB/CyaB